MNLDLEKIVFGDLTKYWRKEDAPVPVQTLPTPPNTTSTPVVGPPATTYSVPVPTPGQISEAITSAEQYTPQAVKDLWAKPETKVAVTIAAVILAWKLKGLATSFALGTGVGLYLAQRS